MTASNTISGQQCSSDELKPPKFQGHFITILSNMLQCFIPLDHFKTSRLWFVTIGPFCTLCSYCKKIICSLVFDSFEWLHAAVTSALDLLFVRQNKPGSSSFFLQGMCYRPYPSGQQLFAGPSLVCSSLFWAWQPRTWWRILCAASLMCCCVRPNERSPVCGLPCLQWGCALGSHWAWHPL